MSKIEKIKKSLISNPKSLKYKDIELILINLGFKKINTKGSHVKFKHPRLNYDIIIPVHNNECKEFYKKDCRNKLIDSGILK